MFAPICTPFAEDEDVDTGPSATTSSAMPRAGSSATWPGSNGENRSLTEDERLRVLDVVVRHKGPGQVVMAGAAYDAQRDAERFLAAAADLGADFGLVRPRAISASR